MVAGESSLAQLTRLNLPTSRISIVSKKSYSATLELTSYLLTSTVNILKKYTASRSADAG